MSSPSSRTFAEGFNKVRPSLDWLMLIVATAGIAAMLIASSSNNRSPDGIEIASRLAVGMTPTDQAITVMADLCDGERVAAISLVSAEEDLLLWEAIATQADDRDVFVIGQAPTTFTETVPLLTERPRAILLRADVTTTDVRSVEFYFADLLPGLWLVEGSYYPDENITEVVRQPLSCPGSAVPASAGRRMVMILGFIAAAGAGAVIVARRMVPSGID